MCVCVDVCIGEEERTMRQNGSCDHVMARAQDGICDCVLSKSRVSQSYNNGGHVAHMLPLRSVGSLSV